MTPFPLLHSLNLHPLHLLPPPLLRSQLMPAGRVRTREKSVLHISPRCLSTSLFSVRFLSSCDKKSQLKCKLEFMPKYWMAVAVLCSPSGLMQDDMFVPLKSCTWFRELGGVTGCFCSAKCYDFPTHNTRRIEEISYFEDNPPKCLLKKNTGERLWASVFWAHCGLLNFKEHKFQKPETRKTSWMLTFPRFHGIVAWPS